MEKCPNINDPDWKIIKDSVGEIEAYRLYLTNNEEIPDSTPIILIHKLEKRFGLKAEIISNPNAEWAGKFENGVPTLNLSYLKSDTPFHEFAHPFISIIKDTKPVLYKNLEKQITDTVEGSIILDRVKEIYPDLSEKDQIEESIVQSIGEYAANSIEDKSFIQALNRLLEVISDYIRSFLSSDSILRPEELKDSITLKDLGVIFGAGEGKIDLNSSIKKEIGEEVGEYEDGKKKKYYPKNYKSTLERIQSINRKLKETRPGFKAVLGKLTINGDKRMYDTINIVREDSPRLQTRYQKEKESSFKTQDEYFKNRIYVLEKKLKTLDKDTKPYEDLSNEIKTFKDKVNNAKKTQSQSNYELIGKETLSKVEEFIISLENGSARDKDKNLIYAKDTLDTWREFENLETETRKLERRLYPFIEKNTHEEVNQYATEKEPITEEKIDSQNEDISGNFGVKGFGSLSDLTNYIARTIGSIIKSAQNRVDTKNKQLTTVIQSEVDLLAKYAKENGTDINKIYDLFIQEHGGTTVLAKPMIQKGETSERNENYFTIMNTPELKRFYEFYQKQLKDFESNLPVKVGKYFIPNIKNSDIKTKIKDKSPLKTREVGKEHEEDSLLDIVPLRFTKDLSSEEKSRNLGAVLLQFGMYSNNHNEMTDILPKVRLLQERLIYKRTADGKIVERSFKKNSNPTITIKGIDSNLYKMVDDVIEMQVKGKMKADEWNKVYADIFDKDGNKVGEKYVDVSGIVDNALSYNSLLRIGLSPITALSNVTFGDISNIIEAVGGRFMTLKGLKDASNIFFKQTFDKEVPETDKNKENVYQDGNKYYERSPLNQLLEELNPLQELDDYDYIEKVKLTGNTVGLTGEKLKEYMYAPQKKGEKWLQSRTMMAVMIKEKYLTPSGELTDKYKNATVKEKQQLSDRIQRLNQLIHGRYTSKEAATLQQFVLFRLVSQFRKWIPAAIENRLGEKKWDNRLQAEIEGRYRTFTRLTINLKDTVKRLKAGELTELEMYNMKKMLVELTLMATSILLYAGLHGGDDDEDKKWRKNPIVKTGLTLLSRVSGDIDFFYNPTNITKLAKNSVPLAKTLDDLGTAISYIPYAFGGEGSTYKTGSRKGYNKFYNKAGSVIPGIKVIGDVKRLVNDSDLEELR
jgi:hypothetical protein